MALKLGEAFATVGLRTGGFDKGLLGVRARFAATLKGMQTMAGRFSGMLSLALGVGLTGALIKTARLAGEQEVAEKKLAAVLRATGHAAGFTAQQLKDMASGLQNVTTIGDETWLSAMAVMLTFRNVHSKVFGRAMKLSADLSRVMGTDLKSSVVMVGKALNDPATGLTAMSRAGVTFSETQKDVIKSLWETGHAAESQGKILDELEHQFGGVEAAYAKTASGGVEQLKNAIGDLGEAFGKPLAKYIRLATGDLRAWTGQATEAAGETDKLGKKVGTFADTLEVMGRIVQSVWANIRLAFASVAIQWATGMELAAKFKMVPKDWAESMRKFADESWTAAQEAMDDMWEGWLAQPPSVRVAAAEKRAAPAPAPQPVLQPAPAPEPEPAWGRPAAGAKGKLKEDLEREVPETIADALKQQLEHELQRMVETPITTPWEIERERRARLVPEWRAAREALAGTQQKLAAAEERLAAARKTPEFTAIADFARSIQSKLYDKKAADAARSQVDLLRKQLEVSKTRLKSIDEQLKKGIVRAQ